MRNLTHNQFVNLYGQQGARLDRDQSVYSSSVYSKTLLLTALSPFLFWAPDDHLQTLEKLWVDRLLHHDAWIRFIDKLQAESQQFILIATFVLNANMAFLSIQSVDNGGNTVFNRSAAQIASYISIVASLGSVTLSLLLWRQNRPKDGQMEGQAYVGIMHMYPQRRGLEILAVLYTLPYALLMWSTLSFLAAFTFMCFFSSSPTTRVLVGIVLILVGLLVVWSISKTGNTRWGWVYKWMRLQSPWHVDLWKSCKGILSRVWCPPFNRSENTTPITPYPLWQIPNSR